MSGPTAEQLAGKPPPEQALRDRLQLLVAESEMAATELSFVLSTARATDIDLVAYRRISRIAAALRAAAAEATEPVGP